MWASRSTWVEHAAGFCSQECPSRRARPSCLHPPSHTLLADGAGATGANTTLGRTAATRLIHRPPDIQQAVLCGAARLRVHYGCGGLVTGASPKRVLEPAVVSAQAPDGEPTASSAAGVVLLHRCRRHDPQHQHPPGGVYATRARRRRHHPTRRRVLHQLGGAFRAQHQLVAVVSAAVAAPGTPTADAGRSERAVGGVAAVGQCRQRGRGTTHRRRGDAPIRRCVSPRGVASRHAGRPVFHLGHLSVQAVPATGRAVLAPRNDPTRTSVWAAAPAQGGLLDTLHGRESGCAGAAPAGFQLLRFDGARRQPAALPPGAAVRWSCAAASAGRAETVLPGGVERGGPAGVARQRGRAAAAAARGAPRGYVKLARRLRRC
eukprot:ctg_653.g276